MTNKFAFFFPAKIIFAEHAVELTPYEGKHPIYLGPIGRKYYFNTVKAKIVFEHIEDDKRQLFVKVGEHFCLFHISFIDNIPALMESVNATCDAKMAEWKAAIDNPAIYEQSAAETRAKIRAEREEQDRIIAARKLQQQEDAQKAYEQSLIDFNNGQMIRWDHFESALKENNIKLPIKTLGYGRANVSTIGKTGYSVSGSSHNSPVLWAAIRQLAEKLVAKQ